MDLCYLFHGRFPEAGHERTERFAQVADTGRSPYRVVDTRVRCLRCRAPLVDNPAGRPAVIAELDGRDRGAPTVMFYLHYDGQPVIPGEWSQPDPFEPVLRQADEEGRWIDVAADFGG